jgi:hypothetical protein
MIFSILQGTSKCPLFLQDREKTTMKTAAKRRRRFNDRIHE